MTGGRGTDPGGEGNSFLWGRPGFPDFRCQLRVGGNGASGVKREFQQKEAGYDGIFRAVRQHLVFYAFNRLFRQIGGNDL